MDKYKRLQQLAGMGPDKLDSWMKTSNEKRNCPNRPTYTKCAKTAKELLCCIKGRSPKCITVSDMDWCMCPDCNFAQEYELGNLFYCVNRSKKEMRQKGE
jgi:hypothetical protein